VRRFDVEGGTGEEPARNPVVVGARSGIDHLHENAGGCDCKGLLNVDAEDDRLPLAWSRRE
jgi:hypothetical protein